MRDYWSVVMVTDCESVGTGLLILGGEATDF